MFYFVNMSSYVLCAFCDVTKTTQTVKLDGISFMWPEFGGNGPRNKMFT